MSGKNLDDRFIIGEYLASGGSSEVYLCRDAQSKLTKNWAVKIIKKSGNTEELEQYIAEMHILDELSHPNMTTIHYCSEDNDYVFLVMNYINGYTLKKKVEVEGPQEEDDVIEWALCLCDVLEYLHTVRDNPIIYSDLNPRNIMLDEHGSPHLLDFGVAKEVPRGERALGTQMGTRGYAAPEQYGKTGSLLLDERTDTFALGATLFNLLTGKVIQYGKNNDPRQYRPSITGGLSHIVKKAVSMQPEDRYQDICEIRKVLKSLKRINADYLKKIKRQFFTVVGAAILTFILAVLSITSFNVLANEGREVFSQSYSKAQSYQLSGDINEAKDYYLQAIAADPKNTEVYGTLFNMLLPGESHPNREAQTKEAIDTMRYSVDVSYLKNAPQTMMDILAETVGLEEPVYANYAKKLAGELKKTSLYKENKTTADQIDAYEIIASCAADGVQDEEKLIGAVTTLIEGARNKDNDNTERMNLYYSAIQMYSIYPEILKDSAQVEEIAHDIGKIEQNAQTDKEYDFRKIVPLHTMIANLYFQEAGQDTDKLMQADSWLNSLSAASLDKDANNLQGKIRMELMDYSGAKDSFTQVLEEDQTDKSALIGMANACIGEQNANGSKDYTEAMKYYNQVAASANLSSTTLAQLESMRKAMA